MSTYQTEWIHKPYIYGTTFAEDTTIGELNDVMLDYLFKAQENDMYFLMNFAGVHVPSGLLRLPSLLQVVNHGNTRWIGVVKDETATSYMTKMLARDKVKMFRDYNTAMMFLQSMVRVDTGEDLSASV